MFVVIPYPSGLAVYILTSGLVGVAQQWWLNRRHPLPAPPASQAQGKRSKNKKQ
jgi:YidC/Oxa1 family membrane protein insertase